MAEVDRLYLTEKARELYSKFNLRPEQSMVVIGSQFGDGYLSDSRHRSSVYTEGHCLEQTEYLKWKASILGVPKVKFYIMKNGYSKGKQIAYIQKGNKAFLDFERIFYIIKDDGKRKKIVTNEALELLLGSPLSLAIFYQDDGEYNVYSNRVTLHTCDFSVKENEIIAKRFEQLLKAPVKVKFKRKQGKQYPNLAFSSKATDNFIKIIKPFIHPTMKYKVDQDISHHLNKQIVKKLIKEYGKKPAKQISKETGMTIMEIYIVAYRLGLTKHKGYIRYRNKPFTEQEKGYLINAYGKVPGPEIAKRLNTSTKYIHQLALKLGLTKGTHKYNKEGEAGESIRVQYQLRFIGAYILL